MSNELPYSDVSLVESKASMSKVNHNHVIDSECQMDTSQPAMPIYHRKLGDAGPLGLLSFACTSYVLSLINISARGVTSDAPLIGMALSFGGTAQFMAGMWEFASGNTFAATAFSAYGSFWWSLALTMLLPHAVPSLAIEEEMMHSYMGFFLSSWFIFTVIIFMASLRSSLALCSLFASLSITFLLLSLAFFTASPGVKMAGGAMGIWTSSIALYTAAATLFTPETSPFSLPVVSLAKGKRD